MTKIIIHEYTKRIKEKIILENINLELYSGKVYGFKGINGCGKTMLLRAISGLIYPSEGSIEIDGEILGKDISFPRSIGILIENPSFLPNATGLENLKLLASIQNKVKEEDLIQVLEKVGLDPLDKRTYRKYSLGMKQKLGIAAAFAENPSIVLLDEPFNALDEKSVELVKGLIRERKQRSLIIMTSHDSESLEEMSDEMIYMEDGKVISNKVKEVTYA